MIPEKKGQQSIFLLCLVGCSVIGFLWYWPLVIPALFFIVWNDAYGAALILGMLLDLIYGPPPAFHALHFISFPFTIFALIAIGLRQLGRKFLYAAGKGFQVPQNIFWF